jgi:hypothetical protein
VEGPQRERVTVRVVEVPVSVDWADRWIAEPAQGSEQYSEEYSEQD